MFVFVEDRLYCERLRFVSERTAPHPHLWVLHRNGPVRKGEERGVDRNLERFVGISGIRPECLWGRQPMWRRFHASYYMK